MQRSNDYKEDTMTQYRSEYRINKKGSECFRSSSYEETRRKFAELSVKRPNVYTMESRRVMVDKHGVTMTDGSGKPLWGCWS